MEHYESRMIELNAEQKTALAMMLRGDSIFLTGSAGTGKSTLIKEFMKQFRGNAVVVAPTGVAALNANGQTIHSFFFLPPSDNVYDENNLKQIPYPAVSKKLRQADCIVIDEISMCRSDMFWAIDYRLKKVMNSSKPFGGKQIIACGDFFQLPPVVTSAWVQEVLDESYGGEYAFQTQSWKDANLKPVVLNKSFRQMDDGYFADILGKFRVGAACKKYMNPRNGVLTDALTTVNLAALSDKPSWKTTPLKICTTNYIAAKINNVERSKIQADPVTFTARVNGKFKEEEYPTEFSLELKVGLRVMLLVNCKDPQTGKFLYINGDCGTITRIVKTKFESDSYVEVELDNGNLVKVSWNTWNKIKYKLEVDFRSGKKKLIPEEDGSFTQMPLRVAYASTIHKTQGLTLERADIDLGNGCFAHGQLYTALSRLRSLDGLHLVRQISSKDIILDERVVDFYREFDKNFQSDDKLLKQRAILSGDSERLLEVI